MSEWGQGYRAEAPKGVKPTHFIPGPGRLLVKILKNKYEGRIIIPETAKAGPPTQGEIVALGPSVYYGEDDEGNEIKLKLGMRVMYAQYVGADLHFDGEDRETKYRLLKDSDLYGIIEGGGSVDGAIPR